MESKSYKFVCDAEGMIYISSAPFYAADESNSIGDYLPMFTDPIVLQEFAGVNLVPYEFVYKDHKYLVDIKVNRKIRSSENFYEILIKDNTIHYLDFQQERSKKNKYKIENERLIELNKRLLSKSLDLEHLIKQTLVSEVKEPLQSVVSAMSLINSKIGKADPSISKLVDLTSVELQNIDASISSLLEYQADTNARSFAESAFCSLEEILEQTLNTLQGTDTIIDTSLNQDRLVFVNKYHFSKTFHKLISFLIKEVDVKVPVIKITSNFDNTHSITFSISTTAALASGQIERIDSILNKDLSTEGRDQGDSIVDVRIAKKMVSLYDGTLNFVNKGRQQAIEMVFGSLISKSL